jgi:hypothetical protein
MLVDSDYDEKQQDVAIISPEDDSMEEVALQEPRADDYAAMRERFMPEDPDLEIESEITYTWDIKDWRTLPRRHHSPTFHTGDHPWKVLFFPAGNNANESVSFYLEQGYSDEDKPPADWYACARFMLVLWNPNDPSTYTTRLNTASTKRRETGASHVSRRRTECLLHASTTRTALWWRTTLPNSQPMSECSKTQLVFYGTTLSSESSFVSPVHFAPLHHHLSALSSTLPLCPSTSCVTDRQMHPSSLDSPATCLSSQHLNDLYHWLETHFPFSLLQRHDLSYPCLALLFCFNSRLTFCVQL